MVEQGTPGLAAVVEAFGPELLTAEGDLDRPAMGRLVFGDPEARRRLEAITHPLIFERYAELEAAAPADALVVHDIPLLAESGRADSFDAVIVVDVPDELRIERMVRDRGWTRRMPSPGSPPRPPARTAWPSPPTSSTTAGRLEELRARVTEVYAELSSGLTDSGS